MATRKTPKPPEPPPPKVWQLFEIRRGIQKLQKRADDVKALKADGVTHDHASVGPLESEIAATIEDVFGPGSREANEHKRVSIYYHGAWFRDESEFDARQRRNDYFQRGIEETLEMLKGLIRRLEEKRDDFRKCLKCGREYRLMDYCRECGTPLVGLDFDPDAPTLTGKE